MRYIHYPDDWEPQDCILVADALVRYARWDCEGDRQERAMQLANEVAASEGLTLEDVIDEAT